MENEISPGVKVQVRVRKCPVRTLGDGGAEHGQVPSPDPAASPDPGALSVSLTLDSSPKRGAKGVDHPLAPQGAAPLRGSPQCAHWGKGSPE